jgi:hypothetical protein
MLTNAPPVNNGVFYVIEVDAAELSSGYPNLRVCFTYPGAATLGPCVVILSGSRYGSGSTPTAIA